MLTVGQRRRRRRSTAASCGAGRRLGPRRADGDAGVDVLGGAPEAACIDPAIVFAMEMLTCRRTHSSRFIEGRPVVSGRPAHDHRRPHSWSTAKACVGLHSHHAMETRLLSRRTAEVEGAFVPPSKLRYPRFIDLYMSVAVAVPVDHDAPRRRPMPPSCIPGPRRQRVSSFRRHGRARRRRRPRLPLAVPLELVLRAIRAAYDIGVQAARTRGNVPSFRCEEA